MGAADQDLVPNPMKVHLFGATSSQSYAPYCLRRTVKGFGGEYDPLIAATLERNFMWAIV